MIEKEDIEAVASATTAVGELIRVAGETHEAKQAGQNIGRAAVTLTAALNNCLLPIAAVNFGFDRARQYFGNLFQTDIAKATEKIPVEALIEPKASVAGPALQALAFSHDEPDLKDLYIRLLATSMDSRCASKAHPAFVEILRQLTAKEAKLLQLVLSVNYLPIFRVDGDVIQGGKRTLHTNILDLRNEVTMQPQEDPEHPAMVDNWVRLGLVNVDYDRHLVSEKEYEFMETRPEVLRCRAKITSTVNEVVLQKGIMFTTNLGAQFAEATGIRNPSAN